ANAAYADGDDPGDPLDLRIELATAYRVEYDEPADNNTGTMLNCWRETDDGCLDAVHAQRDLWDADQCALIFTGNAGRANGGPSNPATMFSVTGSNLFGHYTFHHELAHNAGCSHAKTQNEEPGSPPWAGFGHPSGCYRTIMAYGDACGQGDCPRQNIFSDDDPLSWTCNGNPSTPGGVDCSNQDRLHLSAPILVDHRTVPDDANFDNDYNWSADEAVNFAAANTLSYSSAGNHFEFFSGSAGSFRAGEAVTLGRGFWARSGSSFRAFIHNCTPLASSSDKPDNAGLPENLALKMEGQSLGFAVFPNPFTEKFQADFNLPQPAPVSLRLLDTFGKPCLVVLAGEAKDAGAHSLKINTEALPDGMYFLELTAGQERQIQKVVKFHR
ncbi:MAG: zinc-dependent metalloprotease, partial [Bacteroidota bacterium]